MIQISVDYFYRLKSKELHQDLLVRKLLVTDGTVSFQKVGSFEYHETKEPTIFEKEQFEFMHLINIPVQAVELNHHMQEKLATEINQKLLK